jgi:coenzyme F420-reducing hydrogenase beta subunit
LEKPIAYAARHKDMSEIMKSRSGAVFVAISDYILEKGGVVYGAGYKDHFRIAHKRATTKEERDEFRGSKYVQSDLTGVFKQVKEDLKQGLTVLFSGTPCQTSGLSSFIGKSLRKNLLLVDIVCHGVPGPYIWRDYLTYIEKKHGSHVVKVNFRDKERAGWKAHVESFELSNGDVLMKDSYTYLFYKHIMFRHSCGLCHFTNLKRPSDITLADFWGWEKNAPNMNNDDKGVSLLLINTDKGNRIFKEIQANVYAVEMDIYNCLQPNLKLPSAINLNRMSFEQSYVKHGFEFVMKRYGKDSWRYKMRLYKTRIKEFVKKNI